MDGLDRQASVQLDEAVPQHRLQDGDGVIAVDVRPVEKGITQVLEDLQYGLLKGILCERHAHHSLCGVGIVYYRLGRMTNVDFKLLLLLNRLQDIYRYTFQLIFTAIKYTGKSYPSRDSTVCAILAAAFGDVIFPSGRLI